MRFTARTWLALLALSALGELSAAQAPVPLTQAAKDGKVAINITGMGGSTGDVIQFEVQRRVAEELKLSVAPGTVFKSAGGEVQDMVAATLRGERVGDDAYRPAHEMVLADDAWHSYVVEAYCLDFHKANPRRDDRFVLAGADQRAARIISAGKRHGASIRGIQCALWIDRDGPAVADLQRRFPGPSDDVRIAQSLLKAVVRSESASTQPQQQTGQLGPGFARDATVVLVSGRTIALKQFAFYGSSEVPDVWYRGNYYCPETNVLLTQQDDSWRGIPLGDIQSLELVSAAERGDHRTGLLQAQVHLISGAKTRGYVPPRAADYTWLNGDEFEFQGRTNILGAEGAFSLALQKVRRIVRSADAANRFVLTDSTGNEYSIDDLKLVCRIRAGSDKRAKWGLEDKLKLLVQNTTVEVEVEDIRSITISGWNAPTRVKMNDGQEACAKLVEVVRIFGIDGAGTTWFVGLGDVRRIQFEHDENLPLGPNSEASGSAVRMPGDGDVAPTDGKTLPIPVVTAPAALAAKPGEEAGRLEIVVFAPAFVEKDNPPRCLIKETQDLDYKHAGLELADAPMEIPLPARVIGIRPREYLVGVRVPPRKERHGISRVPVAVVDELAWDGAVKQGYRVNSARSAMYCQKWYKVTVRAGKTSLVSALFFLSEPDRNAKLWSCASGPQRYRVSLNIDEDTDVHGIAANLLPELLARTGKAFIPQSFRPPKALDPQKDRFESVWYLSDLESGKVEVFGRLVAIDDAGSKPDE